MKLYIKTMGCQMNEYDSAKMLDVLAATQLALDEIDGHQRRGLVVEVVEELDQTIALGVGDEVWDHATTFCHRLLTRNNEFSWPHLGLPGLPRQVAGRTLGRAGLAPAG